MLLFFAVLCIQYTKIEEWIEGGNNYVSNKMCNG